MAYDSYEMAAAEADADLEQEAAFCSAGIVKSFHLNDLLTLVTGLMLAQEGVAAVHRLVAFVMETDADPQYTAANIETVKACIEEQLPFLREVKLSGLYPIYRYDSAPTNPYLNVWLEMQSLHFGAEHAVMTYRAWQARKGETAAACNTNKRKTSIS